MRSLLATAALGAALGAAIFLAFVPTYKESSCIATSAGDLTCTSASRTLTEQNSTGVYVFLAMPVALTVVVLVASAGVLPLSKPIGWTAVVVLLAGCLVTGFSIGLLFFPAALLALCAMLLASSKPDTASAP